MLSLLRDREFRILTLTHFFSIAGDQLARAALSVLVYSRTNSALQAAIAYALTFVPAAMGGPLLSGLADRWPRKTVMISSDLATSTADRAVAIPSIPIPLALILIAAAGLFETPFTAARQALLPDVLPGSAIRSATRSHRSPFRPAQVGGFGLAGVLLIAWSPATLLLIDAGTFVLSARASLGLWRAGRLQLPARVHGRPGGATLGRTRRPSIRTVLGDPGLRPLAVLAWSASSFAVCYEALAAPLAREDRIPELDSWTPARDSAGGHRRTAQCSSGESAWRSSADLVNAGAMRLTDARRR